MPQARAIEEVESVILARLDRGHKIGDIVAGLSRKLTVNPKYGLAHYIYGRHTRTVPKEHHDEELAILYKDNNGNFVYMDLDGSIYRWDPKNEYWLKS